MNNTEAPSGIDLHPDPEIGGMLHKRRIALVLGAAALLICGSVVYGGYRRNQNLVTRAAQDEASKVLVPAPSSETTKEIPLGNAALVNPPKPAEKTPESQPVPMPPQQVYVPPIQQEVPAPTTLKVDPEEQRLHEAMLAPTAVQRTDQIALSRQLPASPSASMGTAPTSAQQDARGTTEEVAAQQRRVVFSQGTRDSRSTYLSSTRAPQIGPYEIKSGWEIPAVLEQELNSDLPGEMKALVTQNVYDTATGHYLLIPQGSRLIGKYNSEVGYGQEGVQAIWDRIVYPDGSSIDLEGMNGLDSHGSAGFRDKVDRHYRRTFGMALLTSAFAVAFELSQRRSYGAGSYAYPSAGDTAAAAVGREISQAGTQMFRKNMAVAPTIKIRVGYEFRVRVNRDILFAEPYSNEAQPQTKSQRAGR